MSEAASTGARRFAPKKVNYAIAPEAMTEDTSYQEKGTDKMVLLLSEYLDNSISALLRLQQFEAGRARAGEPAADREIEVYLVSGGSGKLKEIIVLDWGDGLSLKQVSETLSRATPRASPPLTRSARDAAPIPPPLARSVRARPR